MQAEVSPFYADLVKFAQLGYGIDGCLITGYRVNFEIQVGGREDWVELKDLLILPYSVSSGFSYRRFLKYRSDQTAPGLWDPTVPEVSVPPEGASSGSGGGAQSESSRTSTPGNFISFCSL